MTSPTTVDGLVSGINTTQIISQLMQIEAQPQNMLKSKVSAESTVLSAYQAVNSKFAALQTAAEAFTAPNSLTPVLAPLIASATPCAVSVPTVMWVVFPPIVRSRPLPVVTAPPPELVTSAVVTWDWASAVTLKV